jgi:hypothetical protein
MTMVTAKLADSNYDTISKSGMYVDYIYSLYHGIMI